MKRFFAWLGLAMLAQASFCANSKAVLIDGFTLAEKHGKPGNKELSELAELLGKQGYSVYCYSAPVKDFESIRDALNGAKIVVYWGHGVIHGPNCFAPESSDVGGFSIDGRFISPNGLRREIRLVGKAIVILPCACYAAGNSSVDEGKVSRPILERRMLTYAQEFFDIGAELYLACADTKSFLQAWINGKSYEEAYAKAAYGEKTVQQVENGYNFWYRQSVGKEGLTTSSAMIWKRN